MHGYDRVSRPFQLALRALDLLAGDAPDAVLKRLRKLETKGHAHARVATRQAPRRSQNKFNVAI
jgi:hypothetical protein